MMSTTLTAPGKDLVAQEFRSHRGVTIEEMQEWDKKREPYYELQNKEDRELQRKKLSDR